jgi:hypothetical protein
MARKGHYDRILRKVEQQKEVQQLAVSILGQGIIPNPMRYNDMERIPTSRLTPNS